MVIDFEKINEKAYPSFNGGKGDTLIKMTGDERVKLLEVRLKKGCSVGYHKHLNDCEVVYVISGKGKVLEDSELKPLSKGNVHYCKKGCMHSIMNDEDEDLVFFAVVPEMRK